VTPLLAEIVIEFEIENEFLSHEGAQAGLIVLASMLLSFLLIRGSTRLMRSPKVPWWPGSVTPGGLHIHHLVFGIVMMLVAGFVMALQPENPWFDIMAAAFGVGAGLTLDEYALWLHLDDVYWAEEGRRSVDAVLIAAIAGGLLLLGFIPVTSGDSLPVLVLTILVTLAISAIAIYKGKFFMGVAGVLFPLVGLIGAIRLAKPDSPWARRYYKPGSKKLTKSEKRYERHRRRYQSFQDKVAGAPSLPAGQDEG
jgi:hypothetical protein